MRAAAVGKVIMPTPTEQPAQWSARNSGNRNHTVGPKKRKKKTIDGKTAVYRIEREWENRVSKREKFRHARGTFGKGVNMINFIFDYFLKNI